MWSHESAALFYFIFPFIIGFEKLLVLFLGCNI